MRSRICSRIGTVVCAVALCAWAYGEVVVEEHAGYAEGPSGDYSVTWDGNLPTITIIEPSGSELGPYDFDCYDDSNNQPATIQAITAVANIGDVEIMVRAHEGRPSGAYEVWLLQLDQAGVNSSVNEFNISGYLGKNGVTRVDQIAGDFSAKDLANDAYIETLASGCFQPGVLSANRT
jgi:hypothetical protein